MRFVISPLHLSKVLYLPRKSDARSYTKCCTCHANHLSTPTDLMLQNATPLRKSAPWPPNISDEHVSCTAPATRNEFLSILLKCPTPAIVFGNATKPSRFAYFWQGAESLVPAQNPLRLPRDTTSERRTLDFDMCFAPQRCTLSRHLFQKCIEAGVFCRFWLRNVLRATAAPTFSTCQLPKVVRHWGVFSFLLGNLQTCFAPQRRAFFHLFNFQKWSETVSFLHFWRRAIFHFSSPQMAPHPPL